MSDAAKKKSIQEALAREVTRNQESRGAGELFTSHRAVVTAHLARAGSPERERTLCLLGARNLNDVELKPLLDVYGAIDLIDWDTLAMQDGLHRQGIEAGDRVRVHGGIDLSGASAALAHRDESNLDPSLATIANSPIHLPRDDYNAIASLCLLSQLVDHAAHALGPAQPRLLDVIQAIRVRHFRLLLENLGPGGFMLLVSDFVSTDTCPELGTIREEQLPAAAERWLADRNFFTGLNPYVLLQTLRDEPAVASLVAKAQLARPWRWQLSATRAYAVCALMAIRNDASFKHRL